MREKSEKVFTKRELKHECRLDGGVWSSALEVLHFMRWIFFFFFFFWRFYVIAINHQFMTIVLLDSYLETSLRARLWII